jgi:hypothetical protein
MNRWQLIAFVALGCMNAAHGQLLPQVQVPPARVPDVSLPPLPTDPRVRDAASSLAQLPTRAVRADQLLRQHRELDRDTQGELVVRAEVLAIDITDAALAKAQAANFRVLRTQDLTDLEVKYTVLQTPGGMSASRGLKRLRKLDPDGTYDYNHVYFDSGVASQTVGEPAAIEPSASARGQPARVRVGLIDSGVDPAHGALSGSVVHRSGCGGAFVPGTHGLAVASLLADAAPLDLYAADVYCGAPTGGAVDAVSAAFAWLALEQVAVINVSLVGPRNALLERIVASLVKRGHVIVAAVGNDGPAAPPMYPAAYQGVIGVTAVDAKHKVLLEACRGKHVHFAARGADLKGATQSPDGWAPIRGTSFAAPLVAMLFAARVSIPDAAERERALAQLTSEARDLGRAGRDEIYGVGEVGPAADIKRANNNQ